MKTIIIYRLGSIGDTVVALPCFHRIATTFPNSRRIVLTNVPVSAKAAPLAMVLSGSGLIHGTIEYPIELRSPLALVQLARRICATGAKILIYLTASRGRLVVMRDVAFFHMCGISQIFGAPLTDDLLWNRINPETGIEEPEAERLARCLAPLGPINLDDPVSWDLRLTQKEVNTALEFISPLAGRSFIAVNVGGKVTQKDWGDDNWKILLSKLAEAKPNLAVVFIGSSDEAARSEGLTLVCHGPVLNGCGVLTPREAAAVLERAEIFVGHDSGPLHLAASRGTRCVGLFGNLNRPNQWHPYGHSHRIIHEAKGVRQISPENVLIQIFYLLENKPHFF